MSFLYCSEPSGTTNAGVPLSGCSFIAVLIKVFATLFLLWGVYTPCFSNFLVCIASFTFAILVSLGEPFRFISFKSSQKSSKGEECFIVNLGFGLSGVPN